MTEIASLTIEIDVSSVEESTAALGQFIKLARLSGEEATLLGKISRRD